MRIMTALAVGGIVSCAVALADPQPNTPAETKVFDAGAPPPYSVTVGQIPPSRFEGHGRSGVAEINGDWALPYFSDVWGGDVELGALLRSSFFMDAAGLDLPKQVAQLGVSGGWTWRYTNGTGLRVRLLPCICSDLEHPDTDIFYLPASCALAATLLPGLAGFGGIELRPGFERTIMPIVGLDWEITDYLRLKIGLPESRCTYQISRVWSTGLGLDWRSTTFTVADRTWDRMTLEDFRVSAGAKCAVADQLKLIGDVGRVLARNVERQGAADVSIEDAWFARVGIEGSF